MSRWVVFTFLHADSNARAVGVYVDSQLTLVSIDGDIEYHTTDEIGMEDFLLGANKRIGSFNNPHKIEIYESMIDFMVRANLSHYLIHPELVESLMKTVHYTNSAHIIDEIRHMKKPQQGKPAIIVSRQCNDIFDNMGKLEVIYLDKLDFTIDNDTYTINHDVSEGYSSTRVYARMSDIYDYGSSDAIENSPHKDKIMKLV